MKKAKNYPVVKKGETWVRKDDGVTCFADCKIQITSVRGGRVNFKTLPLNSGVVSLPVAEVLTFFEKAEV